MSIVRSIIDFPAATGREALGMANGLGSLFLFFCRGLGHMFTLPLQVAKTVQQVYFIGVKSVAVIALIGLFTGMVLGLQGY